VSTFPRQQNGSIATKVTHATVEELLEMVFSESHAITKKYPEVAVVQQVHKVLNDTEILAGCTSIKFGESSVVNSAELFLALFTACTW
jgi:hypothetical protein